MYRKTTGIGLAALMVAGSLIAVAPAAEAATCAVGRWRATSTVIRKLGLGHVVATGLEGTVLKISASGRLVYNYSRSKPLVVRGDGIAGVAVYDKILREQAVVSGGAHGTFVPSPSTATGNATSIVTYTQPAHTVIHYSVADRVKAGGFLAVPQGGTFTCSKRTLHLHEPSPSQTRFTMIGDWWFRRF